MLLLKLSPDGLRIDDVSYDAIGCSISQAAASVMHDLVVGRSVADFSSAQKTFLNLMHGEPIPPDQFDEMGDAEVFAGVSKYPARVKCALLPWMAAQDALHRSIGQAS